MFTRKTLFKTLGALLAVAVLLALLPGRDIVAAESLVDCVGNDDIGKLIETIAAASAGETIRLSGKCDLIGDKEVVLNKPLNLIGASPDNRPTIKGQLKINYDYIEGTSTLIRGIDFVTGPGAEHDSIVIEKGRDITIEGCSFDGGTDVEFGRRGIQASKFAQDIAVDNCTFSNGYDIGIQGYMSNLAVKRSEFIGVKSGINQQGGGGLTVTDCYFNNKPVSAGNSYGVRYTAVGSKLMEVSQSTFEIDLSGGFTAGADKFHGSIILRDSSSISGEDKAIVKNNTILGGVLNQSKTTTLDAKHNWWGSPNGPVPGQLHPKDGVILVCPWLLSEGAEEGKYRITNTDTDEQFCNIQDAIDAEKTENGHTIKVTEGMYFENVLVNKAVTLMGAGRDLTTVTAVDKEKPVFKIIESGVNVSGFKVTGATGDSEESEGNGFYLVGVSQCLIKGNDASGNSCGINLEDSSKNEIIENITNDNTVHGITLWSNDDENSKTTENKIIGNISSGNNNGIRLSKASKNTLEGNILKNNEKYGISISASNNTIIYT